MSESSEPRSVPPKPQRGRLRDELIRRQQGAMAAPAQSVPPARRCGGCRGRNIKQ